MTFIKKIFSQTVDDLYYFIGKKKTCNKILNPDLFDGIEYDINDFFSKCQSSYFNNPILHYKDFAYPGAPNLHDGFHFNATDKTEASKFNYRPMIFDSPIKTLWKENDLVPFRWFKNENKKSKVILLFSPGWARQNLKVEKSFCSKLFDNGIDAALMTKPYHQERTPIGAYSGEYFISGNAFWTTANFRHYVAEIRLLIQYMRKHYEYVGLIGMSSGGFQASLAIDVEPVDFYFPFITGENLGSIVWESKITKYVKNDLMNRGIDEDLANKVWAIGDQLFLGHNLKAKHVKQYVSLYDEVIPLKYQLMLWETFGRPEKMDLECAHVSVFFHINRVVNDITKFIKEKLKN